MRQDSLYTDVTKRYDDVAEGVPRVHRGGRAKGRDGDWARVAIWAHGRDWRVGRGVLSPSGKVDVSERTVRMCRYPTTITMSLEIYNASAAICYAWSYTVTRGPAGPARGTT